VGKSAIFSRLTGVKVIISNYPGTTVEFCRGYTKIAGDEYEVIDVPGTYSLEPTNEAEKVAVNMISDLMNTDEEFIVIDVIDATNLERNLNLTLQLIKLRVPMVSVLNFWDETKHRGIDISAEELQIKLTVPVIPTVGVTGEGISKVVSEIKTAKPGVLDYEEDYKWRFIGDIVSSVQTLTHHHHTFLQRLEDITIHPLTGIPIALLVLSMVFLIIRFIGEGFITYIADPFFENIWAPAAYGISKVLGGSGVLHDIVIGRLVGGQINFDESLGLLTTGLYVPFAVVLPYVFAFYLAISFLEDFGYLPRISILVDNLMHKIGVHGYSVIPFMLGFGCNVPGVLATRIMETKRERFITATLMALTVPCTAQLAMIFGLLSDYGIKGYALVFASLFFVWFTVGLILNKIMKGRAPELFLEIPPYRMPYFKGMMKKVWMRVHWFLKEAVPWVLTGVLLINIFYTAGIIDFFGRLVQPVVSGLLGLPSGAVASLIIGFLRKDVAVGMLIPLNLTLKQLIIAAVVLTMYFPCMATFSVFLREFGIKDTAKSAAVMILSTLIVGSLLNIIL